MQNLSDVLNLTQEEAPEEATTRVLNFQEFLSNGTWTRPAGVDQVYVKVVGGGGGGGTRNSAGGGCGGGGGAIVEQWVPVTGNVSVVVGAGGSAQQYGSQSSFGDVVAPGGGPGVGFPSFPFGGIAGNARARNGEHSNGDEGGAGGSSFGRGANARTASGPGMSASANTGGGGGGAYSSGGTGGTGGSGRVQVWWFTTE